MEVGLQSVLVQLIIVAIVGIVTCMVKLWLDQRASDGKRHDQDMRIAALELRISENYLRHSALDEVRKDIRHMQQMLREICKKLELPAVRGEEW